jgi:hypothetical protein
MTYSISCAVITLSFGYLVLPLTSGYILRHVLTLISPEKAGDGKFGVSKKALDTGTIVGKCENFLILTFMLLNAYTALALIFAAKTVVRKEDIKTNTLYYLAGTMVNVTYSILFSVIIKVFLCYCLGISIFNPVLAIHPTS